MKFPTKVSSGGRSYVVRSEGQYQNVVTLLCQGRYIDADRLFERWESYREQGHLGAVALPPQEEDEK